MVGYVKLKSERIDFPMKLAIILIVFLILTVIHVATHAQTMRADGKTVTKMTLMAMFATIGPVYAFGGFVGYMLMP